MLRSAMGVSALIGAIFIGTAAMAAQPVTQTVFSPATFAVRANDNIGTTLVQYQYGYPGYVMPGYGSTWYGFYGPYQHYTYWPGYVQPYYPYGYYPYSYRSYYPYYGYSYYPNGYYYLGPRVRYGFGY